MRTLASINEPPSQSLAVARTGGTSEVLRVFLRLGCTSFGGPIAHLGYFHTEFVERRKWCDEETFGELVGLAQSMPGPASSQIVFALGLIRAGWQGGLAAWFGFTMPSAMLMLAFAFGHKLLTGRTGAGVVHGLQLVSVAVVAQAIVSMRGALAPDSPRMALALVAAAIVFQAPAATGTVLAITAGALLGWLLPRSRYAQPVHQLQFFGLPKRVGALATAIFVALLLLLRLAAALTSSHLLAVISAFYRTGALVFGGGHVVLPLLEGAIVSPGWVDQQSFLAGYGAAQALPGPLFTFAAYLGATIRPTSSPVGFAALALIAIFLPGLLVLVAVVPFWNRLRQRPQIQTVLRGVNAAVVGILIAAFVRPVCSSALHSTFDITVAVAAFALLVRWKVSPWIIVVAVASVSAAVSVF